MKRLSFIFALFLFVGIVFSQDNTNSIDLSGVWRFQLDPMGFGKTPGSQLFKAKLSENIVLPGTTDLGGKGIKTTARYVDRLTRKFEYSGQAWYQREVVIPEDWHKKEIILKLERCHWETTIYVDGKLVAADERLSTPNRFMMTKQLTPGIHTITICIDNRLKYPMDQWNHGTTEYTQTNWNGIVGDIELIAKDKGYIASLKSFPDIDKKKVSFDVKLNPADTIENGEITLRISEKNGELIKEEKFPISTSKDGTEARFDISLGNKMKLWDEFNPNLYKVHAQLNIGEMEDEKSFCFGMRKVEQGKHHVRVNDRNVHLRGALDCAVFPITGYPAMEAKDWKRIFETVKEYGLNHVRFHSWCPPEAAFIAADEVGIYLQAELPMWIKDVGQYPARRDFFEKEMYAMLEEYGNHPSFILMCNGNENQGDFDVLEDLVQKAQKHDNRRLYSASTARKHVPSDQFYTSHVTSKGGITVYEGKPSTMWDKRKESDIDVPVIAHESGQRCMYPNFKEMKKYTGVVEPRNFEVFQERLARNGMLHQAEEFFRATGAHTVLQYKEVNEALLRTPNSGGFQLLGLADFPGQGSAFVGILDAFWEDKGLVTPEKYRESCAPTVLLARFPKRAYTNDETFKAGLEVYHYGKDPIDKGSLTWELVDEHGKIVKNGSMNTPAVPCATVDSFGGVEISLADVKQAKKLTLKVGLDTYKNEWDIWVYPAVEQVSEDGYVYTREWNEQTKKMLRQGKKVFLIPEKINGRKTRFASHFWNPIMFRWKPMIVGTLLHDQHPALDNFPTSYYADWQWWDILNNCKAVDLTEYKDLTPLIQSVDTYEFNRKLGIAFEARVGEGQLFVLCIDPTKKIKDRAASRQLINSIKKYMASGSAPSDICKLEEYQVDAIINNVDDISGDGMNDDAVKQLLNK
ncbi:MAG: sugar-binding domain-containing protein [Bacteroidales bacterium]